MNDSPFFDTNVLLYAAVADDPRAEIARALLAKGGLISVQGLNEFASVARRKLGRPCHEISEQLAAIRDLCPTAVPVTVEAHQHALAVADRYGYSFWDALVIAAALDAHATVLYSEDMQDGQVIEGMRIQNPFMSKTGHPGSTRVVH